ncbi:alpha-galactosidase [Heyndrickxia sp. NPDC080065]|uniref:alpha-galactosidase n=1 Tax=Heyndrickxia sp. NPDC080065 TaxID=3390568 RepID=UPI003D04FC16
MGIHYDLTNQIFHLQSKNTSYIFQLFESKYLKHLYWGKKLRHYAGSGKLQIVKRTFTSNPEQGKDYSLDTLPQEYPCYGTSDFRNPAYQIQLENGSTITDLRYYSHRIFSGKKKLEGLPATYIENENEATTLEIDLIDSLIGLKVILTYCVYERQNVITRSVRFQNEGKQKLCILRALSMNVDFQDDNYDLIHLPGAWARERDIVRYPIKLGAQLIESRRGASSHQQNPFIALSRKETNEDHGDVYGFSFVYSGNFLAQVEVDQFRTTRVSMGINPFDFTWKLHPNEAFQCPEVVMVYSSEGIGDMSRTYHSLYRKRLARGYHRDKERPILINNWEATYFKFNEDKLLDIAKAAKNVGIELFVLDDGWFGKRDNAKTSLGDWYVHKKKLPNGLDGLAKRIHGIGMKFGLWFEPEMISVKSELYLKHPDWCLHVPNRNRTEGRNQLVLDLSRKDVCDEIISMVSNILANAPIDYVKWDMNRHMTEIGSAKLPPECQRETAHRYMLGLYGILEEITTKFPRVLFESCSGGGGRFDPGMLYYMPQTWTSDNTDAISRLKIQYGTSIVYPAISIGSHVSAVPNHQVHRTTSLELRGHVAQSGNLGYELDLTKLSTAEMEKVKAQIKFYKEIRFLIQFGSFHRILSPFEGNETAWMFVSENQSEAIVFYYRILAEPNSPLKKILLKGLNPKKEYQITGALNSYGGDELMYSGVAVPSNLRGDFQSFIWRFREI